MKKIIAIIIISLYGCKSNYGLSGTYIAKYNSGESNKTIVLNFKNRKYKIVYSNFSALGKFKISKLSDDTVLLIFDCWTMGGKIMKSDSINVKKDSINFYFSRRNLGNKVIELDIHKEDSLHFRETYVNELERTIAKGSLVR